MNSYSQLSPTPPPAEEILYSIRTSCEALSKRNSISISSSAIIHFLSSLSPDRFATLSNSTAIRLPLRFATATEELNLLSTLAILNFLSSHRIPLKRLTNRGAYDNILLLLLSAHLAPSSTTPLTTAGLKNSNIQSIAALLNIQLYAEQPHPVHGTALLLSVKDQEAWTIVGALVKVCNQTGQILEENKYATLGEWMVECLVESKGDVGKILHKVRPRHLFSDYRSFPFVVDIDLPGVQRRPFHRRRTYVSATSFLSPPLTLHHSGLHLQKSPLSPPDHSRSIRSRSRG